jgi:hypothetical protein
MSAPGLWARGTNDGYGTQSGKYGAEHSVIRCQGQYCGADREGGEQDKVVGLGVHVAPD